MDLLSAGLLETAGLLLASGGTYRFSRRHTLRGPNGAVSVLELAASASAGAAELILRLPSGALGFTGSVPAGVLLSLPSSGRLSAAPATVAEPGGAAATLSIALTVPLSAPAASGASVEVAPAAVTEVRGCVKQAPRSAAVVRRGSGAEALVDFELEVAVAQLPAGWLPQIGDVAAAVDGGGAGATVLEVRGPVNGTLTVLCGGGRS